MLHVCVDLEDLMEVIPLSLSNRNIVSFRVNNMFNRVTDILAHTEFKCLCVPGQLSLEVTNMPRTAKVRGSNLTRICSFFKQEVFCFK